MGNRQTSAKRQVSATDNNQSVPNRQQKLAQNDSKSHKLVTPLELPQCPLPSLSAPTVGKAGLDGKQLQLSIYRSYSQLATSLPRQSATLTPDIKVYRRNSSRNEYMSSAARSMSLPRSFGRPSRYGQQLEELVTTTDSRQSIVGNGRIRRSSSRASTTSNPSSTKAITKGDFPSTEVIRRRLQQFEKTFVSYITDKYNLLPVTVQLSNLLLAVNRCQCIVTLADLLLVSDNSQTPISHDFLELCAAGQTEFVPCIPMSLFPGIIRACKEKVSDTTQLKSLCRDIVTLVAAEAAVEVARMFEYQLSILLGDTQSSSVTLLAEHCAERAVDYAIRVCHSTNRNSLSQGAVRGRPPKSGPLYVSAVVGQRELKWNLCEIVTRPALRRDRLLTESHLSPSRDDACPWQFFSSAHSDPMLYGYRGQMIDWDYVAGVYKLNTQDESMFKEEVLRRYNDFHRQYDPYIRLIGIAAMQLYIKTAAAKQHLDQYMIQMSRDAGYTDRDTLLPAYRPFESIIVMAPLPCDIGRVDAPRQLLTILNVTSVDESHIPVGVTRSCILQPLSYNQQYVNNHSSPDDTAVHYLPDKIAPSCENRNIIRSRVQQTGV